MSTNKHDNSNMRMRLKLSKMFARLRHSAGKLSLIALAVGASAATSTSWAMGTEGQLRLQGEVIRSELAREGPNQICHLKVRLRFSNAGEKPLIVVLGAYGEKRDWWVVDAFLSRSEQDALNGKPFSGRPAGPANSQSLSMWVEARRQLSIAEPPPALTHIIRPHETFLRELETFVIIKDDDSIAPGNRVWLQLVLEMWPSSIEPAKQNNGRQSFGDGRRRKWQSFGNLWLEPIISSPIPFDLPVQSMASSK